jgi:hypothetical protein
MACSATRKKVSNRLQSKLVWRQVIFGEQLSSQFLIYVVFQLIISLNI